MKKQELLDIASVRGAHVGSGALKADIVNAVLENQGNGVV